MTAAPGSSVTGRAAWRSPSLGEGRTVDLEAGTVRFFERGSGPPIVFVHGALVNANLWRGVVERLAGEHRCIAPDWPLGSHALAMRPEADLTPPGLARLIADLLDELELEDVTLVGNDTGGGLSQIVATRHPERLGRLVLTSCDAFENFPPKAFRPAVKLAAKVPGVLPALLAAAQPGPIRNSPLAFGWLAKRPIERRACSSYLLPCVVSSGVRRDTRRFFDGLDARHTIEAAERLSTFDRPALIAWSREDRFFPPAHGERLAELIPDARLAWIDDSYTFSAEDQPARLAELIAGFASATTSVRSEDAAPV